MTDGDPNTGDEQDNRDPSQISLPWVDSEQKVGGYKLRPILGWSLPGLMLWAPALFYYAYTGDGQVFTVVFAIGCVISAIGITMAITTDYRVTTPLDRVMGEVAFRLRQFGLPLGLDETAGGGADGPEPIHGYRRFMYDGMAEMAGGRYVALVCHDGRTTERQTTPEANQMIRSAASGIRQNVPTDQSYVTFTTAFDTDPSMITGKFEAQLDGGRWVGAKWRYAREAINDAIAYERKEAEAWDAREVRTYQQVSVHEDELEGRQSTTVASPVERVLDWLDRKRGHVDGYHGLPRHKRKQLRKKMNQRKKMARSVANATDGVTPRAVGPDEHALVVSKFWSGVDGGKKFANGRSVSDSVNLSVWPPGPSPNDEMSPEERDAIRARKADDDAHRPPGASRYIAGHDHVAKRDAVAGVEDVADVSALADLDEAVEEATDFASTEVQSPMASDAGRATEDDVLGLNGEDAVVASMFAQLREGLLRPIDSGGDDGNAPDSPTPSPIEEALAPHHYDEGDNFIRVGDQYVRVFWLKDWPKLPPSNFLKPLITKRGLDFDLKLFADPIQKADAIARIKQELSKIGAEVKDSEERQDHEAQNLVDDRHFYQRMFSMLSGEKAVRSWDLNGYLAIRVGHTTALDTLADQVDDGVARPTEEELDIAKLDALDEVEETVRDLLEDERVGMTVQASYDRHDDLLRSCAPGAPDVYQQSSQKNRGGMVGTATVAATFPACRDVVQEPTGTEYGRSLEHGGKIMASQHDRGAAPHKLTIADSGSGKSYLVGHQVLRWWLAGAKPDRTHPNEAKLSDPAVEWLYADGHADRTVICVDTMGGFESLVEAMDGNHIPVDGDTRMNPLEIHSSGDVDRKQAIDSFKMGFDAAFNTVLDIIEEEGGNADDFKPLVKDALRETYKRAGIHPKKPETHRQELSPHLGDFLDTLRSFADDPQSQTLLGVDGEADQIKDEIKLLARRLTSLKSGGALENLNGQGEVRIEPGKINWIDLQAIEGSGTADQSTTLPLILRYIYEAVKSAPGDVKVVIDEAHYLLHSPRIRQWLQQSARHWRHHRAGLWFLTHRPDEFVSGDDDEDAHKNAIRAQCNTIEFLRTKDLEWPTARDHFHMNWNIYQFVKNQAVTGESGEGYSTGAVFFRDRPGWNTFEIKVGPFEHALLSWKEDDHGPLEPYLDQFVAEDPLSPDAIAERRRTLFERAKAEAKEELQAELELAEAAERVEQAGQPTVEASDGTAEPMTNGGFDVDPSASEEEQAAQVVRQIEAARPDGGHSETKGDN